MTTIVIPLYEGVTHLDFTGPHEFLANVPGTNVIVASMGGVAVESHGLTFDSLADLEALERCDVLFIPGGLGCISAMENAPFSPSHSPIDRNSRLPYIRLHGIPDSRRSRRAGGAPRRVPLGLARHADRVRCHS